MGSNFGFKKSLGSNYSSVGIYTYYVETLSNKDTIPTFVIDHFMIFHDYNNENTHTHTAVLCLSADPVCQGLASSASPMPPFALMRGICLTLQATAMQWQDSWGEELKDDRQMRWNLPKVTHTYEI